jgi:hypothetical protein
LTIFPCTAPFLFATDSGLVLTFSVGDVNPQQHILWLADDGTARHDYPLDLTNIWYAYGDADHAMLVEYRIGIPPDARGHQLVVHGFNSGGDVASLDTLFSESLPGYGFVVGADFESDDGNLTAALMTGYGSQYPEVYYLRLIRYGSGQARVGEAWDVGAIPQTGYFTSPSLHVMANGWGVVGFGVYSPDGWELRCIPFDNRGQSHGAIVHRTLTSNLSGLSLYLNQGTVYAEFTAAQLTGTNGAYLWAFPYDTLVSPAPDRNPLPNEFAITAYPNPFNSATRIAFTLPSSQNAVVDIFDALGRRVEQLSASGSGAGHQEILWHADALPSGTYFVRLNAPQYTATRKLLLVR